LVKLTPTGSACWYPPLRSGAAYRGRYLQFLIVFEEQNGLAWKNVGLLGLLENRAMFG
jgi:hypothetical protein